MIEEAARFDARLRDLKTAIDPAFSWYPYGSLSNFVHLEPILAAHPLAGLAGAGRMVDIGTADGDVAFFLEHLGYKADVIDHAPPNYNHLRGAELIRRHLGSALAIHDIDLDSQFSLPAERYDLALFLGILYHLKNPFFVLEALARCAVHALISTRVARFSPDGRSFQGISVAYLLNATESNNDSTNYWIFSETGLRRLFERTGWDVLAYRTVGDTEHSDPARNDRDERAFVLVKSRQLATA